MNVVIFLHQFLSFALASDRLLFFVVSGIASLLECITIEENLSALITNFHRFPTESLLIVFSRILHANTSPDTRDAFRESLNHLAFPSILISIINHSDPSNDSCRLSIDPSLLESCVDDPTRLSARAATRNLYLFSLDLLRCFYSGAFFFFYSHTDSYCLVLDDASLINGLINMVANFLTDRTDEGGKITLIAASLLLSIGSQCTPFSLPSFPDDNFCLIENESGFIASISDLLFRGKNRYNLILLLFAILNQYAQSSSARALSWLEGNLQKLVGDRRFSEVLRFTYRTITQNATLLQSKREMNLHLDEPLDEVLNLSLGFSRLLHVIANRREAV